MVTYIRSDLEFILDQIKIAEQHAAGTPLFSPGGLVPAYNVSLGLRTVDGSYNHLLPGQEQWGAADRQFPSLLDPQYRPADGTMFDPDGPGPAPAMPTAPNYNPSNNPNSLVFDSSLRTISNLLVDQTLANSPDIGLSQPFNGMMALFGQFFDHGLDLISKGGGTVFVPLQPDDPLYVEGSPTNFMVLSRRMTRGRPARTASSGTRPMTTCAGHTTPPRPSSTRTRPTPRTLAPGLPARVRHGATASRWPPAACSTAPTAEGTWAEVKARPPRCWASS
jgi:hypothetical protein